MNMICYHREYDNDIWDVDEYGWGCRREYTRIMSNDVYIYIYYTYFSGRPGTKDDISKKYDR